MLADIVNYGDDFQCQIHRRGDGTCERQIEITISGNEYNSKAATIYVNSCGKVVLKASRSVPIKAITAAINAWHIWSVELKEREKYKNERK